MNNELSDDMLERVVGGTKEVFIEVRNYLYAQYQDAINMIKHAHLSPSYAASQYKSRCENYINEKADGLSGDERNEVDRILRVNHLRIRNWTDDEHTI